MKPLLSFLFFLLATAVLATGLWKSIDKGEGWLLLVGLVSYIGLFIRYGCLSH